MRFHPPPQFHYPRKEGDVSSSHAEALESRTLLSTSAGVESVNFDGRHVRARPGEWVVRLDCLGDAPDKVDKLNAKLRKVLHGAAAVRQLGADGFALVRTPAGISHKQLKAALRKLKGFVSVEPNLTISRQATAAAPVYPNDPRFFQQYALNNTGQTVGNVQGIADADIDAPEAWGVTTGNSGVAVAVLDSGVDFNHPDLSPNLWTNPGETANNGVDDDNNGYVDDARGWDFADDDNDPADVNGHGTFVAGVAAARGNNASAVAGVAWDSTIVPLKIYPNDPHADGDLADAIEAINYATALRTRTQDPVNVRVLNNSWGYEDLQPSPALESAIAASAAADMLFVAAAGNGGVDDLGDNNDLALKFYPASSTSPNVVSVTATDNRDGRPTFANYGPTTVDLGAPGVTVMGDRPVFQSPATPFWFITGTSASAPHVSGVAALAWAVNPGATYSAVKGAILGGVDVVPSLTGLTVTGGRLNAFNTLQAIGQPAATVVGRHVFYNDSTFDGGDAAATAQDDNAIAADKSPLLPGGTATFAHYTSYDKGLNGVMVDIAGLASTSLDAAADFTFRVGNTNTPGGWAAAPDPAVSVRALAGGVHRVTLIWPPHAIQKQWLQVTVKANASTGLAADDVFYFGNAVGESGNSTADAQVTYADELGARANKRTTADPAPVTFKWDYNRDGLVNTSDQLVARQNKTGDSTDLNLITVPAAGASSSTAPSALPAPAAFLTTRTAPLRVLRVATAPDQDLDELPDTNRS